MPHRERTLDPWLLSVTVIWGLNAVANKVVLQAMGPAGILVFRYLGCALVLTVASLAWSPRMPRGTAKPWGVMLLVGLWVSAQQLLFIYALDWTTASEASLIISAAPIFTAVIGAALGMELISGKNWAGILTAAGGVALIVLGGGKLSAEMPTRVQGDLVMVVSALLYGSGMVFLKRIMDRYGAMRVMSWAFLFGSLVVVPAGAAQVIGADWARFDATLWGALIYSAFIAGGYGFIVWYRTIARTSAARTAVYQYLVPVVSLLGAAALLGERLTALQLGGAAVVLVGLVMARSRVRTPAMAEAPPDLPAK